MNSIDISIIEQISVEAGKQILEVYNEDLTPEVTIKEDNSPLTEADRRANTLIIDQLTQYYPDIPVLSEESDSIDYSIRKSWNRYWLVDPLDGTKEFINHNGEFTVNIALIEAGNPVAGVVHVPVQGITYSGRVGSGASKLFPNGERQIIQSSRMPEPNQEQIVRVVASRSHRDKKIDSLLDQITDQLSSPKVVSMGSSLKMCVVAEGSADIYPRLAPTCEWDTGAAHAVLRAAGGQIVELDFRPLRYNQKAELLNPDFIAIGDVDFDWQSLVARALD